MGFTPISSGAPQDPKSSRLVSFCAFSARSIGDIELVFRIIEIIVTILCGRYQLSSGKDVHFQSFPE